MAGTRPRTTTPEAIEDVAVRLFTELGFEDTTVDQIAASAGVSRTTFFRHFPNKAAVVWTSFERELNRVRALLNTAPADQPAIVAVRWAIVAANRHRVEDVPWWRARRDLLASSEALQASLLPRYRAWEDAIAEFVARRRDESPTDLATRAIAGAICAMGRAAFHEWLDRADADLPHYIDESIAALSTEVCDRRWRTPTRASG